MEALTGNYKQTKTTEFMNQLNNFVFLFGLPNFWVKDTNVNSNFSKIYKKFNTVCNICVFILFLLEFGAIFTQNDLTDKQTSDLLLFSVAHGIVICFICSMFYHEPEIKEVVYKLGIGLKRVFNDLEAEALMIKRCKFFSAALILNCIISISLITMQALMKTVSTGEPFTTIITIVPDINDTSTFSNVLRAIFYIFWWIYLTRTFSVYTLVICLTTATSHQFKNLNRYFYSLNDIFFEDNFKTHEEREAKYEKGLKIGIALHSESLTCTNQLQSICREVFSGQIIFNITLLILLMYQMANSERTLTNVITLIVTAATILFSTGFFMWNAGDVTVEAAKILTSIYCSGWENCYSDCSKRVRKLIVIAMMQAQRPVVLSGLGIIPLSYQSYVSIVKSSYSIFSVLY